MRGGVVPFKVFLSNSSAAFHGFNAFGEAIAFCDTLALADLTDKGDRTRTRGPAKARKHRTHEYRLRRRNARVRIPHLRPCDHSALDDHLRFGAEKSQLPQHKIGEFADLD